MYSSKQERGPYEREINENMESRDKQETFGYRDVVGVVIVDNPNWPYHDVLCALV